MINPIMALLIHTRFPVQIDTRNAVLNHTINVLVITEKSCADPHERASADPGENSGADLHEKSSADPHEKFSADPHLKSSADPHEKYSADPHEKYSADPHETYNADPHKKSSADPGSGPALHWLGHGPGTFNCEGGGRGVPQGAATRTFNAW